MEEYHPIFQPFILTSFNITVILTLNMNILSNMEEVANVIIRPSRYFYKNTDLGPKKLKINSKEVTRTDFEVKNPRGFLLKGSIFTTCE